MPSPQTNPQQPRSAAQWLEHMPKAQRLTLFRLLDRAVELGRQITAQEEDQQKNGETADLCPGVGVSQSDAEELSYGTKAERLP